MTKHVFTGKELPHRWIVGDPASAHTANRSMRYADSLFYSYSTPIAAQIAHPETGDVAYLVSNRDYSVTTCKHIGYVLQAIPSEVTVFRVENVARGGQNPSDFDAQREFMRMVEGIGELRAQAKRARVNGIWLTERADDAVIHAKEFAEWFKLGDVALGIEGLAREIQAQRERERDVRLALQAEQQERLRQAHEVDYERQVAEWRAGKRDRLDWNLQQYGPVALRVVGKSSSAPGVETTLGANVPLRQAQWLAYAWREGQVDELIGRKIGVYTIDSVSREEIRIGCHKITATERDRLIASEGW